MRKHITTVVLALLIVGSLLTYSISYQVDELSDIVLIETFGKVTHTYIGRESGDAGLKWKFPWPIQKVIRYDSRLHMFEDPENETITHDKQNILVTTYCAWRIKDPATFHARAQFEDPREKTADIESTIRKIGRTKASSVVGRRDMADFINTDPGRMKLAEIENDILEETRAEASRYGVEIRHIGIKSLGLPQTVTEAVIAAMKEERQRDVKRYETGGKAEAQAIKARATRARDQIIAFAERKAKLIRTEGDRAAAKYYAKFQEDPEFGIFLRWLESLKKGLADKAVIVLDGSALPAIRWLRTSPSPKTIAPMPGGKAPR